MPEHRALATAVFVLIAACGSGPGDEPLGVEWTFEQGDCASTAVETIRVNWTQDGGAQQTSEYPCTDGSGPLTTLRGEAVSFALTAEGVDASGVVRAESYGQSASFPDGVAFQPIDITLYPKSSNVIASWNGCPAQVILPYFITVYDRDENNEPGRKVSEVQESCQSGTATVQQVPPGNYIVELDSRAVTPLVRGTKAVTVVAGEDAMIDFDLP